MLPPMCMQTRPQEAAFVLSLLNPDPEGRPSVDAIVRSELLLALHRSMRQRKPVPPPPPPAGMHADPQRALAMRFLAWLS